MAIVRTGLSPGCVGVLPFQMAGSTEQHKIIQPVRFPVSLDSVITERVDMVCVEVPAEFIRRDPAILADAIPLTDQTTDVSPIGPVVAVPSAAAPSGTVRSCLRARFRQPLSVAVRRTETAACGFRRAERFAARLAFHIASSRSEARDVPDARFTSTDIRAVHAQPTAVIPERFTALRASGFYAAFSHLSLIAGIRTVSTGPRLRRFERLVAARAFASQPFRRVFGAGHQILISASTLRFYTDMEGLSNGYS